MRLLHIFFIPLPLLEAAKNNLRRNRKSVFHTNIDHQESRVNEESRELWHTELNPPNLNIYSTIPENFFSFGRAGGFGGRPGGTENIEDEIIEIISQAFSMSMMTDAPSMNPSSPPTLLPSEYPSSSPSSVPSSSPSSVPSSSPSPTVISAPSSTPTFAPSSSPSMSPSSNPTFSPTTMPSNSPSTTPGPSAGPTTSPSAMPSSAPSEKPTITQQPTVSSAPTPYDCTSPAGRMRDIVLIAESISGVISPGTPQRSAFEWIMNDLSLPNACDGPLEITQRYSLAVFYYSTLGDDWTRNDGWLGSGDECTTWYGIICNVEGEIESIQLSENNLGGTIPSEVGAISTITFLSLYDNVIGGSVPVEIFGLEIKTIDIEDNILTGQIFPDELFNRASTLENFLISFNRFSGAIPARVGELTNMVNFWVAGNEQITGTIPTEIALMTNVENLFMYENNFSGSIPDEIGEMTKMVWIDISDNVNMQGPIPENIGNMTELVNLVIHDNGLTGTIPTGIGNLVNIVELFLHRNDLTGPLPAEMKNLVNLEDLTIQNNNLSGPIPDLSQSKGIFFDLAENEFTGQIPQYLFEMATLEVLYLSNNTLSGQIPSWDFNGTNLKDIWLDNNLLTGPIPDVSPGALSDISELLIYDNKLTGPVPDGICQLRDENPDVFISLQVDCTPVNNVAQNPCETGCCTRCFIGKGSDR